MIRTTAVLEIEGVTRHHALALLADLTPHGSWYGFRLGMVLNQISTHGTVLVEILNPDGDTDAIEQDANVGSVILHPRSNINTVVSELTLARRVA